MIIGECVEMLESFLLANEVKSQTKKQFPVNMNEAAAAAGRRFKSAVFENPIKSLKPFIRAYIITSPLNPASHKELKEYTKMSWFTETF